MEDKTQDVNSLEDLLKAADEFRKWAVDFGDRLAKVLADIQTSKKEEDTWEMKCPYKKGHEYWLLDSHGEPVLFNWNDCNFEKCYLKQGNTFKTKEAAKLEAKRRNLLTRFKSFRDERNGGWKPDWGSYLGLKYYICCAAKKELRIYRTGAANDFCIFGYFKNESDAQRAIELFGDEIKELFVEGE